MTHNLLYILGDLALHIWEDLVVTISLYDAIGSDLLISIFA